MPYEPAFADAYDPVVHGTTEALASDAERRFVRWALERCGRPVEDVLDVGCGKGRFLVPLAEAGLHVTGLDSSPDMLGDCRARLRERGLEAELIHADYETLDYEAAFDAILCMDSTLCYLLETEAILAQLGRFHRALRPGGMLVLDYWNILAQRELFGTTSSHRFEDGGTQIEWQESYVFEDYAAVLRARFSGRIVAEGRAREFEREEVLRALTVEETKTYLELSGFNGIRACADHEPGVPRALGAEAIAFAAIRS